jgi:hypothetical protein
MKKILYISLSLALLLSCAEGGPAGKSGNESGKGGQYLAKINDVTITVEDVTEEFNMLPPDVQQMFVDDIGMENLVEELIKKEILYLESKKKGIQKTEEFRSKLENFRKRLMVEMLLDREISDNAVITDREIRDFYKENTESFTQGVPGENRTEVMELEKVEDLIRQYLTAEKQKEIFESYILALKKSYAVDINRDAVKQTFGNTPAPGKTN